MDRTAEEFVHQLPDGRWFVGDFIGTRNGDKVLLLETVHGRIGVELTKDAIIAARIPTYACKSSAKRAGQKTIERVLSSL
jgi:hypothetical protein